MVVLPILAFLIATSSLLVYAFPPLPENVTFDRRAPAQVISHCTVPNTVALTFDDGPFIYLKNISDTLVAAGAKGTFFFNGNNYRCIYAADSIERVKYAYSHGHMVASHTWSHKDLTTLTWDQIHDEMWRVELALRRILGVTPAFMRPPFGNINNLVIQASGVRGQKVALWDYGTGDSTGSTPAQINQAYTKLANSHLSNLLALNHEVYESTVNEVLPHAISVFQDKGYKLVTVAECLGLEPYQNVTEPETGTWSC